MLFRSGAGDKIGRVCFVAAPGLLRSIHFWIKTPLDVLYENSAYIEDLLAPLERAIADALIPSITGHNCTEAERELLALPVRMGGMGLINPSQTTALECVAPANISGPLAHQISISI